MTNDEIDEIERGMVADYLERQRAIKRQEGEMLLASIETQLRFQQMFMQAIIDSRTPRPKRITVVM